MGKTLHEGFVAWKWGKQLDKVVVAVFIILVRKAVFRSWYLGGFSKEKCSQT